MAETPFRNARGILSPKLGEQHFTLARLVPSSDLRPFIDVYWIASWDLPENEPYRAETLPFPAVHVAIEERRPEVYGVVTNRFCRRLQGRGRVFGIKFRPAMFSPFFDGPLSLLTDRVVSIRSVFGDQGFALRGAVLDEPDEGRCASLTETFLKERLPKMNSAIEEVRNVVEGVARDRDVTRVEQLVGSSESDRGRFRGPSINTSVSARNG